MRLDADRLNDKKVSAHNEGCFAATKNRTEERKEKSEARKKTETAGNLARGFTEKDGKASAPRRVDQSEGESLGRRSRRNFDGHAETAILGKPRQRLRYRGAICTRKKGSFAVVGPTEQRRRVVNRK